jgi:uncharacterized membrane protein YbhN (UPF0104 family)
LTTPDPAPAPAADAPVETSPSARRRAVIMLSLRIGTTVAAIAWVVSRVDLAAVGAALVRVSPFSFAIACASTALNLVVGSLRWRILLQAYGAPHVPPLGTLVRLNYIGFFYNTCLPGGVGGDVVRGVASREAFGDTGATGAVAVVLVDRVLGLVGLLLVVAFTATVFPLPVADTNHVTAISLAGISVSACAVVAIAVGRSLAPHLPSALRTRAERLPAIVKKGPFLAAILLSLVTQSVVAWTGHVIVQSLAPGIALTDSLVVVPLAMATAFLPFLVGGTGAREEVFAQLYGPLGVPRADAIAASLLVWFTQIVVALVGGLLPIPRSRSSAPAGAPSPSAGQATKST